MKKLLSVFIIMTISLVLAGCWAGELGVSTVFDENGAGHRDYRVVVYDDTLSEDPIGNPDDPDGSKALGAVQNNKHIEGGVVAIQDWLENNAPSFLEVLPMETEGVQRIFTVRMTYDSFEEFLSQYEQLVDLSPGFGWSDFTEDEKPTLTTTEADGITTVTFDESQVLLEASMDWAIDGIYNSIFLEADLAGFVDKSSISQFATYEVELGDETLAIASDYDPTIERSDGALGAVDYIDDGEFQVNYSFDTPFTLSTGSIIGLIIGGAAIIGGAVILIKKK